MFGRLFDPARRRRAAAGTPGPGQHEPGLERRFEELRVIHRLSEAVTRAETPDLVYEEALEALARLLAVDRAAVLLWDADGVIRCKASRGLSAEYRAAVTGHSPWSPGDVQAEPVLVEDVATEPSLAGFRPAILREGIRALGFIPLVGSGRLLGTCMVYFDRRHRFARSEVEVARTIALHIGFALERMRRDAELRAVNEALRLAGARERRLAEESRFAEQRAAFLAEASGVLARSLDVEAILKSLGSLLVPRVADWSAIYLCTDDGGIVPAAMVHRDAAKVQLAQEVHRRFPGSLNQPDHPAVAAIRDGRSQLATEVPDGLLRKLAGDPWHLEQLQTVGLRAYLVVPLRARGRVLGALGLAMAESARSYDRGDLALAEDLGQRIALALDNARLFRDAQRAIREAMAATRARDAFLARASHELRTPLTSALGTARLLGRSLSGALREPPERLLEIANRNLDAMLRLVNDLLDASRLAAEPRLEAVPLELRRVASDGAAIVEPQAREKGVTIEIGIPLDLTLAGDPGRLEQLFVNLLANAVRHSRAGGAVAVDGAAQADGVVLRVRDEGDGIPAEDLERIFQPFVRSTRSTQPRKGGTGLGLAICRQIVALHGGRIRAESEGPGMGSTFVVELPAAQPAAGRANTAA